MADGSVPVQSEVAQIEEALDRLLSAAIIAGQERSARADPDCFKMYSMADLTAAFDAELAMTKAERRAHKLLSDPVGTALRIAIRRLGERLHEIGGEQLMGDVCDRVADRDQSKWGWRTDIMDKRWDGIGRTATSAGWCS